MSASSFAKVALDLSAVGRGALTVDGFSIPDVTAVSVRAEAGKLSRVTLDIAGDFVMPEQQAEVLMRVTGLDDQHVTLLARLSAEEDEMKRAHISGMLSVLAWLKHRPAGWDLTRVLDENLANDESVKRQIAEGSGPA